MAVTPLTESILPAATALVGTTLTLGAVDNTNGNSIVSSGREICVVFNIDTSGGHAFTMTGQKDAYGRTVNYSQTVAQAAGGTITAANLSSIVTPRLRSDLWSNTGASGGVVLIPSGLNANLLVGVITGT